MIETEVLEGVLGEHLVRQRWFAGRGATAPTCRVRTCITLVDGPPSLVQVLVETSQDHDDASGASEDGVGSKDRVQDAALYQLLIGVRPAGGHEEFLSGRPEAVIATEVASEIGPSLLYDATVDSELMVALVNAVVPGIAAERERPMSSESTHTSMVFDERIIMKIFRRIGAGGRSPDAEITRALTAVGFPNVAKPVAEWRDENNDYAVVSEFLVGGADGFSLALASLRDLYDCRCDPEEAGGDFAPDARRLGVVTARLHLALAQAFPPVRADASQWATAMAQRCETVSLAGIDPTLAQTVFERLRSVQRAGMAIRSHGDFHLGQVLRTDTGWYVLDFEGEPGASLEGSLDLTSPLRDAAGMIRSFHYAAQVALRERAEAIDERIVSLSSAWERRSKFAFLEGYFGVEGIAALLPPGELDRDVVLTAFELDKAIYEVGYEQAHRPDWVGIPLAAVARIVGSV